MPEFLTNACEEIDAALFSGDSFQDPKARAALVEYMERWGRALKEIEDNSAEPTCHDCGAKPGELHQPGCDVERCPACGGQAISCLSDKDDALFCENLNERVEESERMPWDGEFPGTKAAIEYGFYSFWGPDHGMPDKTWVRCGKDDPGAGPDLNRVMSCCHWDRKLKRMVRN
jgi:hypothetical protein